MSTTDTDCENELLIVKWVLTDIPSCKVGHEQQQSIVDGSDTVGTGLKQVQQA